MTWRIEWMPQGIASFQRIPWRDGERIDAAVQRFAETAEGDAYRLPGDDTTTVRLAVGFYRVRATFDPWDGVMRVWWVYRL